MTYKIFFATINEGLDDMSNTNAEKIYKLVGAEAVLTSSPDLRQYLTGMSTSFGYVVTDCEGTTFYTDPRYIEGAKNFLKDSDITVKLYEGKLDDILKGYKQVAIPIGRTLYNDYARLKATKVEIVDSLPAFTSAMSVKEDYELDNIREACKIADVSFLELLPKVKEGISENDFAAELEYLMRVNGASGTSFETIAAFGENSSVPHHETGMRKLKYGDVVLVDFGCKYGGYCSDCTRTFLFGDDGNHADFKKTYKQVLEAHMLVKDELYSGISGWAADGIARNKLAQNGLDKYFSHTLGHGIGINVHEYPILSPYSTDTLKDRMVFSDEPGVYIEGEYGIRIEDTIALIEGKVESMTDSDKKLTIL